MGRQFTAASSHYLEVDAGALSDFPLTMSGWFLPDSSHNGTILWLGDKDSVAYYIELRANSDDTVWCIFRNPNTGGVAQTSTTYSTGSWQHACAVFTAYTAGNIAAYLDGGGKGTNAGDGDDGPLINPSDRTAIGRHADIGSPGTYFDGQLANVVLRNAALSDAEVIAEASGVHPFRIRPLSIVGYWPVLGLSPEPNFGPGGITYQMAVTGATVSSSPPVQPMIFTPSLSLGAAPPSGVFPPLFRLRYNVLLRR
jgi:hypothetical protein